MKRVHLEVFSTHRGLHTACGAKLTPSKDTKTKSKVTCISCKMTTMFILGPKLDVLAEVLGDVREEFQRAKGIYPGPFNSAHEGYAVMLEEFDELWEEVKKKQRLRNKDKMRTECIQIAAMAVQFAMELT